jgi:predicted transport protein
VGIKTKKIVMPLFSISNSKAVKIEQQQFANELELHQLIDKNLDEIFGIRYIKDEHITSKHGRIETLGIDDSNRPVVIEYKKTREKGQMVQANRYMTWIKQNPDSFELLVRKNLKDFKEQIDFANPRIICFAQEFSIDDKCLALALGAELWKYRLYKNNSLLITREEEPEQLITTKNNDLSIVKIKKNPRESKSESEHLQGISQSLKDLFYQLNEGILDISAEIEQYTTHSEILYKTSRNFACVQIQKKNKCIKIFLRTLNDSISDPKNLTTRIPKTHGYGNITRQLYISPEDIQNNKYEISDIIDLIHQAYETTQ